MREPDETAKFGAALHSVVPRLRRYALAMTGNVTRADDLVQDCLEKAWRGRSTMNSSSIPLSWLRIILRNAYIDWSRRHGHEGTHVELDTLAEGLSELPGADMSLALDLASALQRVPLNQRTILLLSGIEGLSYKEIAEELAIPIGTVMSRLARARDALRQELTGRADVSGPGLASESPW